MPLKKYRKDEREKLNEVPEDMKGLEELSIFDNEKFNEIEPVKYDVKVIGDIELNDNERSVLRLHQSSP